MSDLTSIHRSLGSRTYHMHKSCSEKTSENISRVNSHSISVGRGTQPAKALSTLHSDDHGVVNILENRSKQGGYEVRTLNDMVDFNNRVFDIASLSMTYLRQDLSSMKGQIERIAAPKKENNRPATPQEIRETRKLEIRATELIARNIIKQNNLPFRDARLAAKHVYKQARINYINDLPWCTIERSFTQKNAEYISIQRPAAELKNGEHNIFPVSYQGKGVNCWDVANTRHATNLWHSGLSVKTADGEVKELFSGIRHAVLSPYTIADQKQRLTVAVDRAKEVVSAALFSRPALLERAIKGETVPLRLVSTSLLTPSRLFGNEKLMLKDQMQAWQELNHSGKALTTLEIRDANGHLHSVNIDFEIAPFNFGINELALKFGFGNRTSDEYNLPALQQLLGKDFQSSAEPAGWVGEYLAGSPDNGETVRELSKQIKTIWKNKSHHHDNGEPYKLAQRIAMLANEINSVPCWNCKSGKDRTGMLDVELKREIISHYQGNALSQPGSSLDGAGKVLLQRTLLNSGNLEVQAQNTGVAGSKVIKDVGISWFNLSYMKRIGDKLTWRLTKAMSSFAVS